MPFENHHLLHAVFFFLQQPVGDIINLYSLAAVLGMPRTGDDLLYIVTRFQNLKFFYFLKSDQILFANSYAS